MRKFIVVLSLAGLALASGCREKETSPSTAGSPSADILARYHFIGTSHLAGDTNAARLREISVLSETRKFEDQTLKKLAHAPKVFYGDKISAEQDERGAALIRPLLDDLLRQESFVQARGPANKRAEWALLVELPPDRLKAWGAAVGELTQVWKLGNPTTSSVEGFSVSEVRRSDEPTLIRWAEAGQWFVLGVGQDSLPTATEALRRIKAGGRPIPALSTNWIEAELNFPQLIEALELTPKIKWPRAEMAVAAAGENLRTTMRLVFPEPVTGSLGPWHIPTNIINDPLVSFTAARGIAPLLENSVALQKLGLKPLPDELYLWAQSKVEVQSFLAFPASDVTNMLIRIGERAPSLLPEDWHKRGLAQINWQSTNHQVFWQNLLLIAPNLKAAQDAGTNFIVGGLFPPVPITNPPPAELLSQFRDRKDLVYYDWEVTQPRLQQWRIMAQLFAVIANKPQFGTNTAGLPWLIKTETHLGNTVTQITAKSPQEWSLVRKSHAGFTAIELIALTRWLESTNFPRLSWELPAERLALSNAPASGKAPAKP